MRSAQMSRESTSGQVTNILLDVQLLVWVVVGHALLWGADVDLIILNSHGLLVDTSDDPGSAADACTL